MPIFHPAYLLRNPQKTQGSPKALTWQDIQSVKMKMDEYNNTQNNIEQQSMQQYSKHGGSTCMMGQTNIFVIKAKNCNTLILTEFKKEAGKRQACKEKNG